MGLSDVHMRICEELSGKPVSEIDARARLGLCDSVSFGSDEMHRALRGSDAVARIFSERHGACSFEDIVCLARSWLVERIVEQRIAKGIAACVSDIDDAVAKRMDERVAEAEALRAKMWKAFYA